MCVEFSPEVRLENNNVDCLSVVCEVFVFELDYYLRNRKYAVSLRTTELSTI